MGNYIVSYSNAEDVEITSKAAATKYFKQKFKKWAIFNERLAVDHRFENMQTARGGTNGAQLAKALEILSTKLDDPAAFKSLTQSRREPFAPPPSSENLYGQLKRFAFDLNRMGIHTRLMV